MGCYVEQSIEEHCLNVSRLARELIYEHEDSCGLKDLAYNAGLLHDFGKYRPDFQRYILAVSGANPSGKVPPKTPHAIVGAIEARRLFDDPMIADTLAYCISGHHPGLYDHNEMERRCATESTRGGAMRVRSSQALRISGRPIAMM